MTFTFLRDTIIAIYRINYAELGAATY